MPSTLFTRAGGSDQINRLSTAASSRAAHAVYRMRRQSNDPAERPHRNCGGPGEIPQQMQGHEQQTRWIAEADGGRYRCPAPFEYEQEHQTHGDERQTSPGSADNAGGECTGQSGHGRRHDHPVSHHGSGRNRVAGNSSGMLRDDIEAPVPEPVLLREHNPRACCANDVGCARRGKTSTGSQPAINR